MNDLLREKRAELEALCRKHFVTELAVFGSALREDFTASSDLDFVVVFGNVSKGHYADTYLGLKDDLEHLFGRKVDLIERAGIRNPYFERELSATARLLYAA